MKESSTFYCLFRHPFCPFMFPSLMPLLSLQRHLLPLRRVSPSLRGLHVDRDPFLWEWRTNQPQCVSPSPLSPLTLLMTLLPPVSRFANGAIVAGVFCVIATVGWALHGMAMLVYYRNVWSHSHGEQGHTFADAKRELQLHGFKAYLFRNSSG